MKINAYVVVEQVELTEVVLVVVSEAHSLYAVGTKGRNELNFFTFSTEPNGNKTI